MTHHYMQRPFAPDKGAAQRFFTLMAEGEPVTFQTFDDNEKRKARDLAGHFTGALEQSIERLAGLNARGAGAFWMVNYGDGRGRRTENVTGIRSVFVDLDGAPLAPVLGCGIEPHAIVESSLGRWHAYWNVTGIRLDQFEPVQRALAEKFDGDKSVFDLPRVMRVPGFWHQKREAFQTRIKHLNKLLPYDLEVLLAGLGLSITTKPRPVPTAGVERDDSQVPQGGRHKHLESLFGTLNRKGASLETIAAAMQAENEARCSPPLDSADVARLATDMLKRYRAQHGETQQQPMPAQYGETAMSRDFAERHADAFRFVPEWDQWLAWDGARWRPDVEGLARLAAKAQCDEFAELARNDPLFGGAGARERAALRCQSKKTVDAILDLATVEQRLVVRSSRLDANEWLLNTPTGTANLLDGSLREHRRNDLITKLTSVGPAAVDCKTFKRFLSDVTCSDAALVDYLQCALGACLSGALMDHWLMFWFGPGRNGKNTLGDLVGEILGDYAKQVPVQTLMADVHGSRHPTEIANLRGLRLAISSEIGEGEHWNESRVKELTGDAMLSARLMRQDFFEFRRTHKHLVYGNHRPMLRIVDPAMAARLHIVPFDATFTMELGNVDPLMPQKLRAEAPAILAWLIAGHMKWREDGSLKRCDRVASSTREYLESQSTLDQWVEDRCSIVADDERSGRAWTKASELYADFAIWKRDRGEHPLSQTRWGEWMERRYRRVLADGKRYAGVFLRSRLGP